MKKLGRWLLKYCIDKEIGDTVLGDIEEMTSVAANEGGPRKAWRSYWSQILRTIPLMLFDRLLRLNMPIMSASACHPQDEKRKRALSWAAFFGMSIGLASLLTILAITQAIPQPRSLSGGVTVAPFIISAETRRPTPAFLSWSPIRVTTPLNPRAPVDQLPLRKARRILVMEFLIYFTASLILINMKSGRSLGEKPRAGDTLVLARSFAFVVVVGLLANGLSRYFLPYFHLLAEKQMLLYWLLSLWLFIGGISNIIPAIYMTLSRFSTRRIIGSTGIFLGKICSM